MFRRQGFIKATRRNMCNDPEFLWFKNGASHPRTPSDSCSGAAAGNAAVNASPLYHSMAGRKEGLLTFVVVNIAFVC
jgi:hypothetical protein